MREVLNAIFYVLWTGCPWTALPKGAAEGPAAPQHGLGLPRPVGLGRDAGRIHHALYVEVGRKDARRARPRRSSTARARGELSKGGLARPVRL